MHKIQSVICIDCETGGLSPTKNPITQIALVSFSLADGKEISRYQTYIEPYGDLEYKDEAMQYTGITYSQLLNEGRPIKTVVSELIQEFQKANIAKTHTKKPALMGHNIIFDIGFISYAFKYCKADISKVLDCKEDGYGNYIPSHYDTMWLARMKYGHDESMVKYNLTACCDRVGVSLTDAHDAMNDVLATKDLFLSFMKDLRQESSHNKESLLKVDRPRNHFSF